MKRIVFLFCVFCVVVAYADSSYIDIRSQMLDDEITQLMKQRDEKYAALEQCAKTTKNFKIAGIATLTTTGVGVYANVKLAQKLKGQTTGGGVGAKSDMRSDEQKVSDECEMWCTDFPDDAAELGCKC